MNYRHDEKASAELSVKLPHKVIPKLSLSFEDASDMAQLAHGIGEVDSVISAST